MHHAALDRFQGAVLGVYLGESIDNHPLAPTLTFTASPRSQLLSRFLHRTLSPSLETPIDAPLVPEEAILFAILPEVLAWHDHPERWRDRLEMFRQGWQLSPETIADGTLWGYGLSLLLRGKIPLTDLIPRLISLFPPLTTPLQQQLARVQTALDRDAPFLHTVRQELRSSSPRATAIAISLFAFLQTPDDLALSLRCARQSPVQPRLTAILAGGWAGVYNGSQGCPVAWHGRVQSEPIWQDLDRLTRQLHRVWAGVEPSNPLCLSPVNAIALAGTIQPREGIPLISQEDF